MREPVYSISTWFYLRKHGIEIPTEIEMVIHDKGEIGRPAKAAASNPRAMKDFTVDPKAYLKSNARDIPDELEVILHFGGDRSEPRIDLHFMPAGSTLAMERRILGCYYCSGGICCCCCQA